MPVERRRRLRPDAHARSLDTNPVLFVENVRLYGRRADGRHRRPSRSRSARRASCARARDATVVALSGMVDEALAAADRLAERGISVEVIDPRTLAPLDMETILASLRKTMRLAVAHDAHRTLRLRRRDRGALHGGGVRLPRRAGRARRLRLDVPIPCTPSGDRGGLPDAPTTSSRPSSGSSHDRRDSSCRSSRSRWRTAKVGRWLVEDGAEVARGPARRRGRDRQGDGRDRGARRRARSGSSPRRARSWPSRACSPRSSRARRRGASPRAAAPAAAAPPPPAAPPRAGPRPPRRAGARGAGPIASPGRPPARRASAASSSRRRAGHRAGRRASSRATSRPPACRRPAAPGRRRPSPRRPSSRNITASWQQIPHVHIGGELDGRRPRPRARGRAPPAPQVDRHRPAGRRPRPRAAGGARAERAPARRRLGRAERRGRTSRSRSATPAASSRP